MQLVDFLCMLEQKALSTVGVNVCACVCVFSMGFPLLCPGLKAPFSLICCVSCPLCLPLFSSAHPITAQWLIACLASKRQCVGEKKMLTGEIVDCVCVCLGFSLHSQWPWMEPWLYSNHWHTPRCNREDHTHMQEGDGAKGTGIWSCIIKARNPLAVHGSESTIASKNGSGPVLW